MFDGSVDGDPNCDGASFPIDDEFVEIVNIGASSVDLTGFTLFEDDFAFSARHTFASGTMLDSGSAIVIYGGGSPECVFPTNVISDIASSGSLGLDDTGDTLTLKDSFGTILDIHTWTSGGSDQSVVRLPEFVFGASFVDHSTIDGLDYSPGTDVFGNMISIP